MTCDAPRQPIIVLDSERFMRLMLYSLSISIDVRETLVPSIAVRVRLRSTVRQCFATTMQEVWTKRTSTDADVVQEHLQWRIDEIKKRCRRMRDHNAGIAGNHLVKIAGVLLHPVDGMRHPNAKLMFLCFDVLLWHAGLEPDDELEDERRERRERQRRH